jgi:hypothetical protein
MSLRGFARPAIHSIAVVLAGAVMPVLDLAAPPASPVVGFAGKESPGLKRLRHYCQTIRFKQVLPQAAHHHTLTSTRGVSTRPPATKPNLVLYYYPRHDVALIKSLSSSSSSSSTQVVPLPVLPRWPRSQTKKKVEAKVSERNEQSLRGLRRKQGRIRVFEEAVAGQSPQVVLLLLLAGRSKQEFRCVNMMGQKVDEQQLTTFRPRSARLQVQPEVQGMH